MRNPTSARQPPLLALILAALLGVPSAWAVEEGGALGGAADTDEGQHWGLGLGVGTERSPYKGISNRTVVLPLVNYENRYVRLFGNVVDAKLPSIGNFDFSLRAKVALGEGYKASDSVFLAGMDKRTGGVDLGVASAWRNPVAKLTFEWLTDVTGHSKGQSVKLGAEHSFSFDRRFEITPHVGVNWLDKKYVDYYYGVKASEATAGRPSYVGRATTDLEAGVRFGYAYDQHSRLFLDVGATQHGAGITDSPIVGKKTSPALRIGYLYRF
jgi:outer membrane protein